MSLKIFLNKKNSNKESKQLAVRPRKIHKNGLNDGDTGDLSDGIQIVFLKVFVID